MRGDIRKVQLTGGATLIVSLPKEWAKRISLAPGDEVLVVTQPDDTLILIPKKLGKRAGVVSEMTINQPVDVLEVERLFLTLYIGGAETIIVRFSHSATTLRRQIKEFIRRRIVDMEIVEEASDRLIVQSMISATELAVVDITAKMLRLVANMLNDLTTGLEKDDVAMLRDVIERDDEVDRLYWLMERQLKRAAMSRYVMLELKIDDPRDLVEYVIIAKSIERMADHICRIAYVNQEEKIDMRIVGPILAKVGEFLKQAEDLVTSEATPQKIAELQGEIAAWSQKTRREEVLSDPATSIAKESAVRIGEYIGDIVESLGRIRLKDKAIVIG
ncbi:MULTISPECIES: phosphate uptake regulator PhoU [Pyrobaculum]|uniref:Phosphate uptake regulator, PhoU n=2 Tax=Pyrobaculum arsenaticum TaxID=121277 RepID=A4WM56_PYRAR|nr:phosphate uptake regulator PhoU [Pyrobaculum arsenaticum]ABP51473.1 phosphate uptake regulator, PhoU [Pyrobaculum arsenaticum DSM 13514]MCY0890950.1 phosphate uptake regulator PhoU [Pyrobaculum arsenaticum]NYR16558.1 phosphate uptake regulator PhoU [Pyrobaculum arsenaticum]